MEGAKTNKDRLKEIEDAKATLQRCLDEEQEYIAQAAVEALEAAIDAPEFD